LHYKVTFACRQPHKNGNAAEPLVGGSKCEL
jgi:hypothetical protein